MAALALLALLFSCERAGRAAPRRPAASLAHQAHALRLALEDLTRCFGSRYPRGPEFLERLRDVIRSGSPTAFATLKREALLANPLLDFDRLLVLKRREVIFPTNHECNWSLKRTGYHNEIAILSPVSPEGEVRTLYRPRDGGYLAELDLHWDGDRLLFAKGDATNWKIYELALSDQRLRPVLKDQPADVDAFDPCYLPDGNIVFASTASYNAIPCWHGKKRACNLYLADPSGAHVRQLCFDQDNDLHPSVLESGQVVYSRWDYTGIFHIFLRPLMVMNPDGTGQRVLYGSNSWWPNALYFPRAVPGAPGKLVAIASGHHGVCRMGELVLLDTTRGSQEADGVVQRIPGRGEPVRPIIRDRLVDGSWPKFLHPWPLSEKYFIVAAQPAPGSSWGIYLVDVFDNMVLLHEEPGYALLEPIPLKPRPKPPTLPVRVVPGRKDALVYMHDVHSGPGLAGVPRGTVKRLRVLAYEFGYPGMAGPDKIGLGGPWEVMRILGTVPVESDGSAFFRVPACTPLAVQPLDEQGRALQLMRSWFTAMPGEVLSCVGCHEGPRDVPDPERSALALRRPAEIEPWLGPPRGFDFGREVQPVLDRYCVGCHGGKQRPDLRGAQFRPDYRGRRISGLGVRRMHPEVKRRTGGRIRYTPAYEALLPYIRRVGIEDTVSLLVPGEYCADTSELVQMLAKGHHGVALEREAWERLYTWIDLNAPCHGTWREVCGLIPGRAHERRLALRKLYGGPADDPEAVPDLPAASRQPVVPGPERPSPPVPGVPGWPFDAAEAARRQAALGVHRKTLELGNGVRMELVRIPPGEFVMGDPNGEADERPPSRVRIARPFWIGATEVTNEQFRLFDPLHDSGHFIQRNRRSDGPGYPLNEPKQPVVRVSWVEAMEFCRWLSERAGMSFRLPTEAEWEYACRAGSDHPLFFGGLGADFSLWANMADKALAPNRITTGGVEHIFAGVGELCVRQFDDHAVATAPVGSYRSNPWGLHDVHGNAAEWTLSDYRPYPYRGDGREAARPEGLKVVRGGSFHDRPKRCRSAFRLAYLAWRKVFNVGFRVVAVERPRLSRPR